MSMNTSGFGGAMMLNSSVLGGGGGGGVNYSPDDVELSRLRHSREEYQREMLEQNKAKLDLLGKIASEMGLGSAGGGDGDGDREGSTEGRGGGGGGGGGCKENVSVPGPVWTEEAVNQLNEAIGALDETLGTGEEAHEAAQGPAGEPPMAKQS